MAEKRRLIWRLYPSYLLIIVISLVAATWYSSVSARKFFLKEAESDLEARAILFERQVLEYFNPLDEKSIDLICKRAGQRSSTRITVILPSGRVAGDSETDPLKMDNHADRPEFIGALAGKMSASIRYSRTLDKNFMYVGIPIRENNEILAVVRTSIPIDVIDMEIDKIQRKIMLGGFLIAVFAAIVSLIISRRISKPIEKLREGAKSFAKGDFRYRLPFSNIEEIASLYDAMKDMAAELNKRISTITRQRNEIEVILSSMIEGIIAVDRGEKIINMNEAAARMLGCDSKEAQNRSVQEVIRNSAFQNFVSEALSSVKPVEREMVLVSDRERFVSGHGTLLFDAEGGQIGALIVLNDITRLKRLENIRTEFVANVSHEIKTPITAIKGFVETLFDGEVKEEQDIRRFLEIIIRHVNRLEAIIEDLLRLSRIEKEAESEGIHLVESSVRDTLETAMQVCKVKAESKGIRMELDCEETLTAQINPPLIEQAVVNLLDNAIKYSDENSLVRLKAAKANEIVIEIIDEGRGIEQEHLPRLFERFYRVDKARSRRLGGTGLGLAIVKHIVQAHKGRVSVKSVPGQGSTFSIHLPKA